MKIDKFVHIRNIFSVSVKYFTAHGHHYNNAQGHSSGENLDFKNMTPCPGLPLGASNVISFVTER